jgi:hypothetical protein
VEYPHFIHRTASSAAAAAAAAAPVQVWDDVVDAQLVDALYRIMTTSPTNSYSSSSSSSSVSSPSSSAASSSSSSSSWGTYVTMEQVLDYWKSSKKEVAAAPEDASSGAAVMDEEKKKKKNKDAFSTTIDSGATTKNINDYNNAGGRCPCSKGPTAVAAAAAAQQQQYEKEQRLLFNCDSHDDLALRAVEVFLRHAMMMKKKKKKLPSVSDDSSSSTTSSTSSTSTSTSLLWTMDDMNNLAHGVAVWALSAPIGSQVPYHLDYAEQVRYETNIIVPPVLAGTLQCSPIHENDSMIGGDFLVYTKNNNGLQHYETFGYKGMKQQLPDFNTIITTNNNRNNNNNKDSEYGQQQQQQQQHEWMRIPYRYNRMIIQP